MRKYTTMGISPSHRESDDASSESRIRFSRSMREAVAGVASRELTPRLLHGGLGGEHVAPQLPERRLRKHVLAGDLEGALALVHRARMPLREVLDSWIPAVSRDLGQAWQDDSIAWVDAARGHSCLDRLVRRLRPLGVADRGRVLVATLPGELHTLGSLLLAASLQLDGWEVTELREASVDALAEVVRAEGVHHLCISGHDLMALSADDVATLYGGGVSSILVGGAAAWSDRATELGVTWASTAARACARLRTRLPLGGRRRLVVAP